MLKNKFRIAVKKSNRYISAQVIDDSNGQTLLSVNPRNLKPQGKTKQTQDAAIELAKQLKSRKISNLYLSTGSNRYSGRIKLFAEILRQNGISI